MQRTQKEQRIVELGAQMQAILCEMAELEPPDLVTVVLSLPVPLAGYLVEMSLSKKIALPPLYRVVLLEGLVHMALHRKETDEVRRLARLVRHLSDDGAWALFCTHHPEVPRDTEAVETEAGEGT